jgi:hypothetical protein
MKFLKTVIIALTLALNFFMVKAVLAISALDRMRTLAGQANLPQDDITPQRIIINIIFYVLGFVGLFFVASLLYAGFEWMTSGGSEEKISKAKSRLKNSIIGIVIIISSYLITFNVANLLLNTAGGGDPYYRGGVNGNPSGQCASDADCVRQFGDNWICNDRGSCIFLK